MKELSSDQLNALVRDFFTHLLEQDEKSRIESGYFPVCEEYNEQLMSWEYWESEFTFDLAHSDYTRVNTFLNQYLKERGIKLDLESDSYIENKLLRECLKYLKKYARIAYQREIGNYDYDIDNPPPIEPLANPVLNTDVVKEVKKISDLYMEFEEDNPQWKIKTKDDYSSSIKLLIRIIGDIPISSINYETMREYKNTLIKLPPNINKNPRYREKSIEEILSFSDRPVSINTVNNNLSRLSTFFNYAVRREFLDKNYTEGMKIKNPVRVDKEREAFTKSDLESLFNNQLYNKDQQDKEYQFWLPILALFTGARIGELSQLYLEDIKEEGGIHYLDINSNTPDKSLKNASSCRIVPLHPFIVNDLNFIRYIEKLKSKNIERLFFELKRERDGYGRSPGRWFNDIYKVSCGISNNKSFHSFRHTFGTHLKHQLVQDNMISELMGHSEGGQKSRYGKRFPVVHLYENAILKIKYDVDFSHLKLSKWCKLK